MQIIMFIDVLHIHVLHCYIMMYILYLNDLSNLRFHRNYKHATCLVSSMKLSCKAQIIQYLHGTCECFVLSQ